ncbi:MAG: efflux RND transporter permease subunit, partial [Candidatus Aminicenantes bacterium]|nr:efflux RND transporter permease subunit [Candidatus Aminicenantes bacterium]
EFAMLALREELGKARRRLPPGVRPTTMPFVPEDFRVRPFLSYTISGATSLQRLRELVKDKLEFGIGAVKGVAGVTVSGGSDPEIRVVLDREKLNAFGLHPYQVIYAINQRLQTFETGYVHEGNREYLFKFTDAVAGIRDVAETVVGFAGQNPLRVKDVARVAADYADVLSIHRINGQPTVSLIVTKEKGTNTLRVTRDVKQKLDAVRKELPPDLVFKVVNDESEDILKNLKDLTLLVAIITGVIFVMIFVVLRRLRPSLLILSSIAFSLVITFILIYFFRIPMNMLTLGALALGFGMFVDNSVVVFENILRLRERGLAPVEAALRGPREVVMAVVASTMTTVAVFFAFPYFQGRLRIYYLPLAIVISSALIASLFVSFSLIPALSPRLLKAQRKSEREGWRRGFERLLKFFLRHPVEVILVVGAIIFGSYKWFRSEVTIGPFYPPWYSKQMLQVYIGMPPGTDIEKTDQTIRKFEDKVLEADYPKEMNASIQTERATLSITFPPEVEFSYRPYVMKEELIQLATQFAGLTISVYGFDPQGYSSSMSAGIYMSSRIKFFGYNLKKLRDIALDLEKTLKRNPRIKEVRTSHSRYSWYWGDSYENILRLDKDALRRYDIDPQYLYSHLGALIRGTFGTPLRILSEGKQLSLSMKFPEADLMDIRRLQDALITTRGGEYLRLGEIATLEERLIAGAIDRENQQFQVTVMWEFRGPAKAEERYRKAVFASLHLPPGFSATMEERWLMTEAEKGQLAFAIIFSLILIFMILAGLYESFIHPFLILFAVPLALIGVFIAFIVADYTFDSSAYIGVILLGGIVVNNAIILVDHINLRRREGRPLLEAVVEGTRDRVRPILMTTGTTVLGILPLLLVQAQVGVKRQIWSSLALCTVGGLTTSTLFVLVVIPVLYYVSDGLRGWFAERFAELREAWRRF